jgi:hypothetical protein
VIEIFSIRKYLPPPPLLLTKKRLKNKREVKVEKSFKKGEKGNIKPKMKKIWTS